MKKTLIIIGICALFLLMPSFSAVSTNSVKSEKLVKSIDEIQNLLPTPAPEYDGTFIGGLGRIYKEGEEWQYEIWSYIAGVYKEGSFNIMYGNIYNTDEEQIGTIVMLSKNKFMIGRIANMEGGKAPIVGFIIGFDEDKFIGRLMSFFGPAPHMFGQYIPN